MRTIDINTDVGEGFGPYKIGDDDALLDVVTSANVACGYHAGDPLIMDRTVAKAVARRINIGAHIGFADRMGFGRRQMQIELGEIEKITLYQLGALSAFATAHGTRITHISAHGALGNASFVDRGIAEALVSACKSFDRNLAVVTLPNCEMAHAADRAGLRVLGLFLADRGYDDAGKLVPRKMPGALVKDLELVKERVIRVLTDRTIVTAVGTTIKADIDSILVHSDTPGAVDLAFTIESAVDAAGFRKSPFLLTS